MMQAIGTGLGEMMRKILIPLVTIMLLSSMVSNSPLYGAPQVDFTSHSSCSGPAQTDSIQILPPGPVSLPADQSRMFNATLRNADGNLLNGTPEWGADDGSITPQGVSSAIYWPWTTGTHTIWACAGAVNESVEVVITIGTAQQLDLVGDRENVTTDQVVQLEVFESDSHGNSAPLFVPSSGWTIPQGSSIHVQPGQPALWTPGPIGSFQITVEDGGLQSTWNVNVSRGVGQELIIENSGTSVTADDIVDLQMVISDVAGNTWPVAGNWSVLQQEALPWLNTNGSVAQFDAADIGNWIIHAEYSGEENGWISMTDEVTISVSVGRIAQVTLDGHGTSILTGEVLELNPVAMDLDGNIVEEAVFNWSVEGVSGNSSLDAYNQTFTPSGTGQHTIFVDAAGRPASARVQVEWSEPVSLNLTTQDGDWYLSVVTGETLALHVRGLDAMGTWHPYNPVWNVNESLGEVEPVGGIGDFEYHARGVGWAQLHALIGEEDYTFLVNVLPGQLDHLVVTIQEEGIQGTTVTFQVAGFDISGHPVSIPVCDIEVTSAAGPAECIDEIWYLELANDEEQQIVTAVYDGKTGSEFIDVKPTLLGGQFGSSTQVIAGFAILIGLLISTVLVFAYNRVRALEREYSDEEEDEQSSPQGAVGTTRIVPDGGPLPIPPPPMPMTEKSKSRAARKRRKGGMQPAVPPPPLMFGQGMANSTSAFAQPGVQFQSSQSPAAPLPVPPPPAGVGDAPPPVQPQPAGSNDPPPSIGITPMSAEQAARHLAPREPESDPQDKLEAALSAFGPTDDGEAMPSTSEDEVEERAESEKPTDDGDDDGESEKPTDDGDGEGESEPSLEVEVESESSLESEIADEIKLESPEDISESNEQSESALESELDEDSESVQESELDKDSESVQESELDEDSESAQESEPEEPEEPEEAEEWEDWSQEWEEPSAVERGAGPEGEDGESLRPLPGTKPGESGWYFDSAGKPSLWEFLQFGWERKE